MESIRRMARKFLLISLTFLAYGIPVMDALAAQAAGPLTITRIRTGWASDTFAIETNQAVVNPAGCTTPDGYVSDSSHPGYKTYYAAALMAFSSGKPVTIIISDTECHSGRPKIMGVYVTK